MENVSKLDWVRTTEKPPKVKSSETWYLVSYGKRCHSGQHGYMRDFCVARYRQLKPDGVYCWCDKLNHQLKDVGYWAVLNLPEE